MKIVAFVGADGTGKSTQAAMLAARLAGEGRRTRCVRPVFLLFDPWKLRGRAPATEALSPRMQRVSESGGAGRPGRGPSRLRATVGYLYALATYLYMRSAFQGLDYLVCDRYLYQYLYDLFGDAAVSVSTAFPRPDVVFWLDGGLDLLRRRSAAPMGEEEQRYYGRAIAYYRTLAQRLPFIHLDAGADPQRIGDEARRRLPAATGRSDA